MFETRNTQRDSDDRRPYEDTLASCRITTDLISRSRYRLLLTILWAHRLLHRSSRLSPRRMADSPDA